MYSVDSESEQDTDVVVDAADITIGITQPKTYKTNLYPHQLSAVQMLENRETSATFYIQNQYEDTSIGLDGRASV